MIAFILGNGVSRKVVDLPKLRNYGTIYGCNALYRDFIPDYLISVDIPMVTEILKHKIDEQCNFYTIPSVEHKKLKGKINFFPDLTRASSGNSAIKLAIMNKHTTIYLLGFDFIGLDNNLYNNVYSSSPHYRRGKEKHIINNNWELQLNNYVKSNNNIKFIRVNGNDYISGKLRYSNFTNIDMNDFLTEYKVRLTNEL